MSGDGKTPPVRRDPRRVERPRFDFGRLSFRDTVDLSRLEAQLVRVQVLQTRVERGTANEEQLDEMLRLAENMDAVFAAYRRMFARCVESLPRDWFVEDAPEVLDFREPETYEWLRADRVQMLRQEMLAAQREATNAGKV